MPTVGAKLRPVTELRKAQFLEALAANGAIFAATCRAVALDPKVNKGTPAFSTWKRVQDQDPDFAIKVADIEAEAAGAVEREIMRRGEEGWLEPIFSRGERAMDIDANGDPIKAEIRRFSDKLLLARARALMPDQYGTKSETEIRHSGHVTVGPGLSLEDMRALSPGDREKVREALALLQGVREEQKAITHEPGEVIEADFETVEEGLTAEEAEAVFPL